MGYILSGRIKIQLYSTNESTSSPTILITEGDSVYIQFLGGCEEVGGSGILLGYHGHFVVLDYGVHLNANSSTTKETVSPPLGVHASQIDAVVMTHAHLDHSGGIPLLYSSYSPKLLATPLTFDISQLLIADMFKISGRYPGFSPYEVEKMKNSFEPIYFGSQIRIAPNFLLRFFDSGHIPGGVSVLAELGTKKIFYTSDFNKTDTRLLRGIDFNLPPLDVIITESTYATHDHPTRSKVEEDFSQFVTQILKRNGFVIVPAFAVARSQEILCVLEKKKIKTSRYLDGMGRDVAQLYLQYQPYFRSFSLLKRAIKNAQMVRRTQRSRILQHHGIVVTTAGMLKGGPVTHYIQELYDDSDTGIALVGYQLPGTPGRLLMEEKKFKIDGQIVDVKAQIQFFDFSSHIGKSDLYDFLATFKSQTPPPNIFCVHGERESVRTFAKNLRDQMNFNAIAPKNGEVYRL